MKLLSALILGGKVRAVGAAPTDSAETALDDAAQGANAGSADAVLYIGGPPNPGVVSMFSSGRVSKDTLPENLSPPQRIGCTLGHYVVIGCGEEGGKKHFRQK